MSMPIEHAPLPNETTPAASNSAVAKGETAQTGSMANPPMKPNDAMTLQANPYSSASLVPMLVAGLVLTVIAMLVAAALS